MRRFFLLVLVPSAAFSLFAEAVVTNVTSDVATAVTATRAPVVKPTFAQTAKVKSVRRQCEAVTKSGNRCKRNAVSGEMLCRQHLKIARGGTALRTR